MKRHLEALRIASLFAIAAVASACGGMGDLGGSGGAGGATASSGGHGGAPATSGSTSTAAPATSPASSGSAMVSTSGTGGGSSATGASTDGGGMLCPGLGWCELFNTKLADVCPDPNKYPDIQANEGCPGVINDWSGGAADKKRDRLLVWGGGHGGYFGNEVYALDLDSLEMKRLNDPSDVTGFDFNDCYAPDQYPDGRPTSRHTYDALAYIAHADKMFAHAGAKAPCGYSDNDTWILDLAAVDNAPAGGAAPWTRRMPAGDTTLNWPGQVSDYDPNSERVILDDLYNLWAYDYDNDSFELLNANAYIDYHLTGRVDPKRQLFVMMGSAGAQGGGLLAVDISPGSSYAVQDWTAQVQGCDGLLAAIYPGLDYDPDLDKMVGWAGGDTVYMFDPDTKSCTTVDYGGSPGDQVANGTMGRFRYMPNLKVFALVNQWDQDAYTLRLTP